MRGLLLLLLLLVLYHARSSAVDILVSLSSASPGNVSPYMRGSGIEDVNHELYGGGCVGAKLAR